MQMTHKICEISGVLCNTYALFLRKSTQCVDKYNALGAVLYHPPPIVTNFSIEVLRPCDIFNCYYAIMQAVEWAARIRFPAGVLAKHNTALLTS